MAMELAAAARARSVTEFATCEVAFSIAAPVAAVASPKVAAEPMSLATWETGPAAPEHNATMRSSVRSDPARFEDHDESAFKHDVAIAAHLLSLSFPLVFPSTFGPAGAEETGFRCCTICWLRSGPPADSVARLRFAMAA